MAGHLKFFFKDGTLYSEVQLKYSINICLNNGDSVIAKYLNRMKVRGSGRKYNYGLSKVI